jgi:hypothetical protein
MEFDELFKKKIAFINLIDSEVSIIFEDASILYIQDEQQYCCEKRYITCDDDFSQFIGSHLTKFDVSETSVTYEDDDEIDDECHDAMFVKMHTTKGFFTLVTHNEHTGYYAGFDIAFKMHLNIKIDPMDKYENVSDYSKALDKKMAAKRSKEAEKNIREDYAKKGKYFD